MTKLNVSYKLNRVILQYGSEDGPVVSCSMTQELMDGTTKLGQASTISHGLSDADLVTAAVGRGKTTWDEEELLEALETETHTSVELHSKKD